MYHFAYSWCLKIKLYPRKTKILWDWTYLLSGIIVRYCQTRSRLRHRHVVDLRDLCISLVRYGRQRGLVGPPRSHDVLGLIQLILFPDDREVLIQLSPVSSRTPRLKYNLLIRNYVIAFDGQILNNYKPLNIHPWWQKVHRKLYLGRCPRVRGPKGPR